MTSSDIFVTSSFHLISFWSVKKQTYVKYLIRLWCHFGQKSCDG